MNVPYQSRFPHVVLYDEHDMDTGMRGQVFGEVIDADGQSTGKVAVMLTEGGQGCKHWDKNKVRIKQE
jgi:hypothetical protein